MSSLRAHAMTVMLSTHSPAGHSAIRDQYPPAELICLTRRIPSQWDQVGSRLSDALPHPTCSSSVHQVDCWSFGGPLCPIGCFPFNFWELCIRLKSLTRAAGSRREVPPRRSESPSHPHVQTLYRCSRKIQVIPVCFCSGLCL